MSRDDDRDRGRSSRDRDEPRRSSRDDRDDDRGRSRSSRDDDRDRDPPRRSSRDDDDRGSRRGGSGRSYTYHARSAEDVQERTTMGNTDYDKLLKPGVKMYKVRDGENDIRILPPTWEGARHYGLDVYVHYGVGPDRASYLCTNKHGKGGCPICTERSSIRPETKADEEYLKELEAKRRVLIYLVDRQAEREGIQAWFMPQTLDKDINKVSMDKATGEALPIDSPEEGYDVTFDKTGSKRTTKYDGVLIARRSSPLGKQAWLEDAMDMPLPEQLKVYDNETIGKAFGAKGVQRDTRDRDDDRGRDRDDDRGRDRDRDRDRDDDRRSTRDRDDDRGRERSRSRDDEPTWESVHAMTHTELEDLIELKDLPIKPREAKDDDDLADWVCEEMKLKKSETRARRSTGDDDARDRGSDRDRDSDDNDRERLRDMRRRRPE